VNASGPTSFNFAQPFRMQVLESKRLVVAVGPSSAQRNQTCFSDNAIVLFGQRNPQFSPFKVT
jgi:hypothetical protein